MAAPKKTKDYAVNYRFQGSGTIIVSGTTKAEAEENAKVELSKITDKLRPEDVHVYSSQIETLKEGHGRVHTRGMQAVHVPSGDVYRYVAGTEPFGDESKYTPTKVR